LPDHGLHGISRGELQHAKDQENDDDHEGDRLEASTKRKSRHDVVVQFNRKKFAAFV
jgi:hypothetical protein